MNNMGYKASLFNRSKLMYKARLFEVHKLKTRIKDLEFQLAVQAKSITI